MDILPFPIFFVLFWLAISGIISLISGWFFLSKKFPFTVENKTVTKKFIMQSMGLGFFTSYGSCMNVTFYIKGIRFSPLILFRFLHSPIFVKWTDIKKHRSSNFILKRSVFFLDGRRIVLLGRSARFLQDQIEIRSPSF